MLRTFLLAFLLAFSSTSTLLVSSAAEAAWAFPEKSRAVLFWQPKTSTAVPGSYIHDSLRGLDTSRLDADMRRIALQGFNSVVFWVNWGDLMPAIHNVDNAGNWWTNGVTEVWDFQLRPGDPDNYEARLLKVVRSAKKHGLSVVILPFTGTNPALYADAGVTKSKNVCSWWYGIYNNPTPAVDCPLYDGYPGHYTWAMFQNNNLFGMYTRFLGRLSDVLHAEENVYAYVMAWETGLSEGNQSIGQIQLMSNALKLHAPKLTGYYPSPVFQDGRYYVAGTDLLVVGWYGNGSGFGSLNQHITKSRSISELVKPTGSPTLPIFVYEFGYDDNSTCVGYNTDVTNISNGCVTVGPPNPLPPANVTIGQANQSNFINGIVPQLDNDSRVIGYSYFGSQDNENAGPQPSGSRGFGLIRSKDSNSSFNETAKPAWDAYGLLNQGPAIIALGLGCTQGQCIWIQGKRFAGQFQDSVVFPELGTCHVDFYTPNWAAPGFLGSYAADYCSDEVITITIPQSIKSQYTAVNLTVVNKFNRWTAPRYLVLQ